MKIVSFNTLYYPYSHGASSFRDQIVLVQKMINVENPDVAVLLEMPNPHQTVDSGTLAMMQHLQALERWLTNKGYTHQKKLNNLLSVWVVSKKPLIPLLLLGCDNVGDACRKIFQIGADTVFARRVEANSDYVDNIAALTGPNERSVIVGVLDDEDDAAAALSRVSGQPPQQRFRRVLPIIATHARCLFNNTRFGSLLFTFLRAVVAQRGVVVGDMNVDILSESLCSLDKNDQRLADELPPGLLDQFVNLPLCPITADPGRATAQSISYPFEPLNIDGVFAPVPIPIRVGSCDAEESWGVAGPAASATAAPATGKSTHEQMKEDTKASASVVPDELHLSDHRWIAFDAPREAMINVPVRRTLLGAAHASIFGGEDFIDARHVTYMWAESHPELLKLFRNPITVQRGGGPGSPTSPGQQSQQSQQQQGGGGGDRSGGNSRSNSLRPSQHQLAPRPPQQPQANNGNNGVASPTSAASSSGISPTLAPQKSTDLTTEQLAALAPPRSASANTAAPPPPAYTAGFVPPPDLCKLDVIGECPGNCGLNHKACTFGKNCKRGGCVFGHPKGRDRNLRTRSESPAGGAVAAARSARASNQQQQQQQQQQGVNDDQQGMCASSGSPPQREGTQEHK